MDDERLLVRAVVAAAPRSSVNQIAAIAVAVTGTVRKHRHRPTH